MRLLRVPLSVAISCIAASVTLAGDGPLATFHGDTARTGFYASEHDPVLGPVVWTFQTGGPVRSSPVLVEDWLYVGSSRGQVFGLGVADGKRRWAFDAGSPVASTPAVAGDLVFFTTRDNTIFAVDRRTGDTAWSVRTGDDAPWEWGYEGWDYFTSSPLALDGLVIVGSGNGTVYALDQATGQERWSFETGGIVRSSPSAYEGTVFVGSCDGSLYALDLRSGTTKWRFDTVGSSRKSSEYGWDVTSVQSSPAVDDSHVYIGGRDGNLYAVDRDDGSELWRFGDGPSWVVATPAVTGETVYSARSDRNVVRALTVDTGEELWKYDTGNWVHGSPIVVGDVVIVGNWSGRVYGLDRKTGDVLWLFRADSAVLTTPTYSDGALYFGSDDGNVYALSMRGPTPRLGVYWDEALNAALKGGPLAATGEKHERFVGYLKQLGYEVLDTPALAKFLAARIEDGAPSAVVFTTELLPRSIAAEPWSESLLRRYLAAGGKVTWLARTHRLIQVDDDGGNGVALDREEVGRAFQVDFTLANYDLYGVTITRAGREWGLERFWTSGSGVDPSAVTETLALDELGRAAAWFRSFGGPSGRGLLRLYLPSDPAAFEEIRRATELGVSRRFDRGSRPRTSSRVPADPRRHARPES